MNVKQIVTNKIIDQLNNGCVPWRKPWFAIGKQNISGHVYSGINRMLLADTDDQLFMTYKQCQEMGGHVIAGSKAHIVVFWKQWEKVEDEKSKTIPVLRYYNVFSMSQIEGIDADKLGKKKVELKTHETIEDVELFVSSTGAVISHDDKARAFYRPSTDDINMPDFGQFDTRENYYRTLFHELTHWTGAKERLNREIKNSFGSSLYAKEELCAEIGSALLSYECDFADIEQSSAYIKSWKQEIIDDNNIIFWASSRAEIAVNYLKKIAAEHLLAA
jgi:antirestriction protein ArdC